MAAMPDVDELMLINAITDGDPAAFDRLYQQYAAFVYSTCLAMLGHTENARDAMQDTFIQVFRHIRHFRGGSTLSTWIYRIAARKCLDLAGKQRKFAPVALDEWPFDLPAPTRDLIQEAHVRMALLQLKPAYRIVLVLYYFRSFSCPEIAEVLRCPVEHVRVRLHRARQAFRVKYGDEGELP